MAFPVLFPTISFVAGILLASLVRPAPAAALGLAAAFLAAAWIAFGRKRTGGALVFLLAAMVGAGSGGLAVFDKAYEQNALRNLPEGEYLDWTGTACRSPEAGLENDHLFLRVESVAIRGETRPVSGRIRVSVSRSEQGARLPEIVAGDRVRVSAQIISPAEYRNFREPFSKVYLKTQNLHALASAKSPLLVEGLGPGRRFLPLRWISKLRRACLDRIETAFAAPGGPGSLSPEGAVFSALVLGERARMDPETTLALQKSGLYHLFAISGAHIALVSGLLFGLFRLFRLSERPSYVILLALLVFYGFLVEGRASVVRAVIMAAAYIIGKLLWKDVHLLNTISLSALGILIVQPFQAFDAGFQLTFAATLGLILLFPPVKSVLPVLPLKIGDLLALSVAAQLAVMPIIAATFHRVIFSGIILNLIGVPLVTIVMAVGYVFLPAVFLLPFLAVPAAAGLGFLLRLLLASTGWLDGLPFLSYRIPTPPGGITIAYYVFLLLLFLPRRFVWTRRIGYAGFFAAMAVMATFPFSPAVKDLTVTVIDVGQGDAILVEFPGKARMLVDAGGLPSGNFDIGENVVSPVLWDKGIKRIDVLVLTHPHPDHLNGLPAVARNFRIGEFWEGTPAPQNPQYSALLKALGNTVRLRIVRGFQRTIGGVEVTAAGPPSAGETLPADNDSSLVFRLEFGSTSALFPGDISQKSEEELLLSGQNLQAQILKSPHHGSDSSSSEAFLGAVRPEYIVISAGQGNRAGLPHPSVIGRYNQAGARILRTDLQGAVEFRSDGRRWNIRTSVR